MAKLIPRLIGALSKSRRWKKPGRLRGRGGNQYKKRERSECEGPLGTFSGSNTHLIKTILDSFCILWKR